MRNFYLTTLFLFASVHLFAGEVLTIANGCSLKDLIQNSDMIYVGKLNESAQTNTKIKKEVDGATYEAIPPSITNIYIMRPTQILKGKQDEIKHAFLECRFVVSTGSFAINDWEIDDKQYIFFLKKVKDSKRKNKTSQYKWTKGWLSLIALEKNAKFQRAARTFQKLYFFDLTKDKKSLFEAIKLFANNEKNSGKAKAKTVELYNAIVKDGFQSSLK